MQKYDLLERLKKMRREEHTFRSEEIELIKDTASYERNLKDADVAFQKEFEKFCKIKRRLQILERKNKKLKMLIQQKEEQCTETTEIHTQYENLIKMLEDERMNKFCRKECTDMFLNKKTMSTAVQGMIDSSRTEKNQWIPFKIPIDPCNTRDLPLTFWSCLQNVSSYQQQWEGLILDRK